MSESEQADISALVDALKERAEEADRGVEVKSSSRVERIRERVARRAVSPPDNLDMPSLLDTIRREAEEHVGGVRFHDVGTVQHIGDGVATLSGLPRARTDELVTFPTGVQGMIFTLDHDRIHVVLLGSEEGIQGGDLVTATGERLRVPVGHELLGRVVDPLGEPLDKQGPLDAKAFRYPDREAPGIIERAPVDESLHTGLKIVDALVPVGRGQRELIVGDRQTGKTTIGVDAILSQRGTGVTCVYVAVGQKKSSVLGVIQTLRRRGAMEYTIVVVSGPDDPPALRYLAPYAGCTMAEALMDGGNDVLIVFDDLSKHADSYRELSLLLRRPPGREAYPGDIFYLHSRLLERACKLAPPEEDARAEPEEGEPSEPAGPEGGSLTALPIVETQQGNVSAYIPTNLISITDGQIRLDTDLFNRGMKPAVDAGASVSRVGGAAQTSAMRAVVGNLRLELSQYEEVQRFARFGTEVDEATRQQIRRGRRLRAALTQPAHQPLALSAEVVTLLAATNGLFDEVEPDRVSDFEQELLGYVEEERPGLLQQIDREGELPEELRESLLQLLNEAAVSLRERQPEEERQGGPDER